MKELRFQILIAAPKEKVWATLWRDQTLRQWASLMDPGTYMVGELKQASTVQFLSKDGYGVTSLVAEVIPNEYVLFKHQTDTQDNGTNVRADQWTGGKESYTLTYKNGLTTLAMSIDVPAELQKLMSTRYPQALARIKELSETT